MPFYKIITQHGEQTCTTNNLDSFIDILTTSGHDIKSVEEVETVNYDFSKQPKIIAARTYLNEW